MLERAADAPIGVSAELGEASAVLLEHGAGADRRRPGPGQSNCGARASNQPWPQAKPEVSACPMAGAAGARDTFRCRGMGSRRPVRKRQRPAPDKSGLSGQRVLLGRASAAWPKPAASAGAGGGGSNKTDPPRGLGRGADQLELHQDPPTELLAPDRYPKGTRPLAGSVELSAQRLAE